MGTSFNNLRIDIAVDDREANARLARFNKSQEGIGTTAQRVSGMEQKAGQARRQILTEQERLIKQVERATQSAERSSVTFGLRGADKLRAQRDELVRLSQAAGRSENDIRRITTAFATMETRVARTTVATRGFRESLLTLGARVGGVLGLSLGLKELILDTALVAGRNEQLAVVLNTVAKNVAVSSAQLGILETQLKALGISTRGARESMAQFISQGLPPGKITALADEARNLAGVMGVNTTEAFQRLTRAVVTGETQLLRTIGINVQFEDGYKKLAKQLGVTTEALTDNQKVQSRLDQVLSVSDRLTNVYSNSWDTLGKRISSMPRLFEEAADAIGKIPAVALKPFVFFIDDFLDNIGKADERIALLARSVQKFGPKGQLDEYLAQTLAEERAAALSRSALESHSAEALTAEFKKLQDDRDAARETQAKKDAELTKQALTLLKDAQLQEFEGVDKIIHQREVYLQLLGKTKEAIQAINQVTNLQLLKESADLDKKQKEEEAVRLRLFKPVGGELLGQTQKGTLDNTRELDEEIRQGLAAQEKVARSRLAISDRINQTELENAGRRLEQERDLALLNAEKTGSDVLNLTAQQKVALEQRKLDIEIEYLRKSSALTEAKIQADIAKEIAANSAAAEQLYNLQAQLIGDVIQTREAAIAAAQQRTANQQVSIIRDSNQKIFDDLKRQADGVFDALLTRSGSFLKRLSSLFETAALTGIKDIFSTQVARLLAGLGFGGGQAGASGGGGGFGGLLGGLLGGGISRPGAPGGTVGIAGPVTLGTAGTGRLGGLAGPLGLGTGGASLAGAKALFGIGQASPVFLPGGALATQGTSAASILGSTGAGIAGIGLAAYGVARGGKAGFGLAVGGGALAGFAFGGPIGAAIGAAIGGGAALIRSLFHTATEKAHDKIKAFYGVDIKQKDILEQIIGIAKQNYGGNLDLAVASPQVRDLVELYGMAFGQRSSKLGVDLIGASLVERGGQLYQEAQFRYGTPTLLQSSLPVSSPVDTKQVNIVQLDGNATTQFLQGQAVETISNNPRLVESASGAAQRQSYGRRSAAVRTLEPGTVIA